MNKAIVNTDLGCSTISKHIYGHFSEHLGHCIYGGFWAGRDSTIPNTRGIRSDVVQALRRVNVPVLRWPGGCFADEYHWQDGVGLYGSRPAMVNTHWGGVTENNHFGTHEFMDLCEQLGCEPYFCGNVGSGTVREMAQWKDVLGRTLPVASVEDVLRGKVWAAQDPDRRGSKRQKDLADIARLLEAFPELRVLVPEDILSRLVAD